MKSKKTARASTKKSTQRSKKIVRTKRKPTRKVPLIIPPGLVFLTSMCDYFWGNYYPIAPCGNESEYVANLFKRVHKDEIRKAGFTQHEFEELYRPIQSKADHDLAVEFHDYQELSERIHREAKARSALPAAQDQSSFLASTLGYLRDRVPSPTSTPPGQDSSSSVMPRQSKVRA